MSVLADTHVAVLEDMIAYAEGLWDSERAALLSEILLNVRAQESGEAALVPAGMLAEIEAWSVAQFGIPLTELWRRRENARLHPESLVTWDEVRRHWLSSGSTAEKPRDPLLDKWLPSKPENKVVSDDEGNEIGRSDDVPQRAEEKKDV